MNENSVAKFLRIVGIIEAVCGFLLAFILIADDGDLFPVGVAIIIVALVNCLIFVAFGEVISLLQKNVNKQDEVLNYLKAKALKENATPKTVLQDIESNLPEM